MNENQNVDIDREQDNGQITYANEVISTIVSVATTEVDGISAIAGNSGLLGKGKLQIEVLQNLDRVAPAGALLVAAWPRIEGATGLPVRVLAITPKK